MDMNFSFSSIFVAVLSSNLIMIIIASILCKKNFFVSIGYRVLMVGLAVAVFRVALPFELPITKNIYFPKYASYIISMILKPRFEIFNGLFSIWNILIAIWLIGFFFGICLFVKQYQKLKKFVFSYGKELTENKEIQKYIDEVCIQKNKRNHFKIFYCSAIKVPMIFGILKPYILLPENANLGNEELYLVLYHEMMHHFNHDLLVQFFVKFISILYWWNPACWLLKRQVHILMEMHVDDEVIRQNPDKKQAYLECLLHLAKFYSENTSLSDYTIGFINNSSTLIKRFELLTDSETFSKKYLTGFGIIALSGIIYVGSYLLIFESNYCPPEIMEKTFEVTADNSFFVKNNNGTYELYYNNERIETVISLEYYPDDIAIYDDMTEVGK